MPFPPIAYLRWAHRHIGGEPVPYGLANSAAQHLTPADLGLGLDGLSWTAASNEGVPELVEALCSRYGLPPERVLPTAGCTMANFLVCAALVRPGEAVLVECPAYEPLWRVPRALGARVLRFPRPASEGYRVDPGRLDRALRRTGARLVILSNLHNPSGRRTPPERVLEIGQVARRRRARVLWDEIYRDCQETPAPAAAVLDPRSSISTLSLNKTYGLGALKVGWALAPAPVIRRARRAADYLFPYNPPLMERLAARALERLGALRERSLALSRRNLGIAEEWLGRRGDLDWSSPDGGFLGFARFRDPGRDSRRLDARLQQDGRTIVSPGHFFGDPGGFRLGLGAGDAEALRSGLQALGEVLDS